MGNIIALDIDDCILPSDGNYFGRTSDSLDIFVINLKRLVMICDKYKAKIFLTSSWSTILSLNKFNEISLRDRELTKSLEEMYYYKYENMAFAYLKYYLDGYIIGLSCGNRYKDIKKLKKENKVVIIDDWDLEELSDEKCLYIETIGLITNKAGYEINNFF